MMLAMRTCIRAAVVSLCLGVTMLAQACGGDTSASGGADRGVSAGATLRAVRARGTVRCGITQGTGFATPDDAGRWQGFDVDFCRALAVALFDDPDKV